MSFTPVFSYEITGPEDPKSPSRLRQAVVFEDDLTDEDRVTLKDYRNSRQDSD